MVLGQGDQYPAFLRILTCYIIQYMHYDGDYFIDFNGMKRSPQNFTTRFYGKQIYLPCCKTIL